MNRPPDFQLVPTSKKRSDTLQAGYTLLEMMLVVGIIIVLLGSAVYFLTGSLETGRLARVEGDIKMLTTQLKTYEMLNLRPPTTEQGIKALVDKPSGTTSRWRQLLSEVPMDPWGNPYNYRYPGTKNPKGFDLYSYGPDRVDGGGDDIGNW